MKILKTRSSDHKVCLDLLLIPKQCPTENSRSKTATNIWVTVTLVLLLRCYFPLSFFCVLKKRDFLCRKESIPQTRTYFTSLKKPDRVSRWEHYIWVFWKTGLPYCYCRAEALRTMGGDKHFIQSRILPAEFRLCVKCSVLVAGYTYYFFLIRKCCRSSIQRIFRML